MFSLLHVDEADVAKGILILFVSLKCLLIELKSFIKIFSVEAGISLELLILRCLSSLHKLNITLDVLDLLLTNDLAIVLTLENFLEILNCLIEV